MPELPEVEVTRRGLAPRLQGRRLEDWRFSTLHLRHPYPELDAIRGVALQRLERRAKYLLFMFDNGWVLSWHLGMSGHFHLGKLNDPSLRHEHVRLNWSGGISVRYCDPRRFGYLALFPPGEWRRHPWFAQLGPEPLETRFSVAYLQDRCAARKSAIKQVLMDARVVVGVGNIYACESLFRAGIHPARAARRIAGRRIARLHGAIRDVLREAIAVGGSSIRDFLHIDGSSGYFAHRFAVYGRAGAPCHRCGHLVRRIVQQGRGTFYCPACQR